MRRKALLDADHWSSFVDKKSDVAGSFGGAEIELLIYHLSRDNNMNALYISH